VHGAFAESASWNDVIHRLQDRGYTVIAAANPLRNVAGDAEFVASILESIEGPVVLVGHSYGKTSDGHVARISGSPGGGRARIDVIAPPGQLFGETNDNSVAILLTYGTAARVLLAGDAEARELEHRRVVRTRGLKSGHQRSKLQNGLNLDSAPCWTKELRR
jgi:hypothetical protein